MSLRSFTAPLGYFMGTHPTGLPGGFLCSWLLLHVRHVAAHKDGLRLWVGLAGPRNGTGMLTRQLPCGSYGSLLALLLGSALVAASSASLCMGLEQVRLALTHPS